MDRSKLIAELQLNKDLTWDIIVIGGGATGLGIALDAVLRGYKTVLLEQSDFAKATSSRSTKLVHGGVRYLAQGDILLVREALYERGIMLKNAPNITANQEFIIPVYTYRDVFIYSAGLKFYDLLAGRFSLGKSYFISRNKTLERLPFLNGKGLKGGVVYHDGQFDDSRMAVALAQSCYHNGGIILNYFRVTGLLKNETGKLTGVDATDEITGKVHKLKGRLIINATGVFADAIHQMDDPQSQPAIRPSQGVHIVIDNSFLESSSAIMIPKTDDGRVLFAIPWYGKVIVGTTDTPLDNITQEPRALQQEIDFLLRTAGKYMTRPLSRKDIRSVFAGLRPLAADPGNPSSTKEISRRHKITLSASGLLSIIGGKWTSYRRMAEETIDRAIKSGILVPQKCITRSFRFSRDAEKLKNGRLKIYGAGASEIEKLMDENPALGETLDPALPYTAAEIIWICRNEMPVALEDVLARRTRSLFLDVQASLRIATEVADLMASELEHDDIWKIKQLEEYRKLCENYL